MQKKSELNLFRIWWLAIRPKTLPAAASGVVMGSALAWADGSFQFVPALAALFVALLLQIGSNVAAAAGAQADRIVSSSAVTTTSLRE